MLWLGNVDLRDRFGSLCWGGRDSLRLPSARPTAWHAAGAPDGLPVRASSLPSGPCVLLRAQTNVLHDSGTMDHWDPALVNPLAARRPVVLIDNSGVGRSQGEIPETLTGWAKHYVDVIQALGFRRVDVMGYSMGGCVAQLMALNAPSLVRCLILCGTTPSYGKGVVSAPAGPFNRLKAARTPEEHRAAFLEAFFAQSERSQAAGAAAWDRISKARADRADYVPPDGSRRQAIAFAKFMHPKQPSLGSFNRLDELRMPVLVANGQCLILVLASATPDPAHRKP